MSGPWDFVMWFDATATVFTVTVDCVLLNNELLCVPFSIFISEKKRKLASTETLYVKCFFVCLTDTKKRPRRSARRARKPPRPSATWAPPSPEGLGI